MSSLKKPKQRVLFQSPTLPYHKTRDNGSMASSSVSLANAGCLHTPSYNLKTHPLQKSISSSSLLSSTKSTTKSLAQHEDMSPKESSSAPVSRQISTDVGEQTPNMPLKIIADAAKQIIDKKTVAWNEDRLMEIVDISMGACTPSSSSSGTDEISPNELKSRYKSEPNLSCLAAIKEKPSAIPQATKNSAAISLTRKLIKGVSMSNLKFPFSTPESTKRLVRTVSSQLKRRSSDDAQPCAEAIESRAALEVPINNDNNDVVDEDEDLDDETFEDNSEDQLDSDVEEEQEEVSDNENKINEATNDDDDDDGDDNEDVVDNNAVGILLFRGTNSGSGNCRRQSGCYRHLLLQHQNNLQRNLEHVTSTPSMLLGRRSMSPITKSTQRMPKAMQESIMTPRSRKPVMVLPNALGGSSSSDQNQTACQTDLSSFREQDEEESISSSSTEIETLTSFKVLKSEGNADGGAIFKATYGKATTTHQEFLEARAKLRHRTSELATPITTTVMLSANMEEKPILPTAVQEGDELTSDFK